MDRTLRRLALRAPLPKGSSSASSRWIGRREFSLRGGGNVQLTPSEVALLEAFARAPCRLVRRDDLHLALHGTPWDGRSSSLDVLLHGLRKKLESLGGPEAHGVEIRTVRGEGFVLLVGRGAGRP